jgi:hypothetical protein
MRAPQPRTAARLTLTFAWANEQVGRWLVGMTIPFHYAGLGRFFRYLLLDWWPGLLCYRSWNQFRSVPLLVSASSWGSWCVAG